jgi:hypothetical protein
MMVRVLTPHSHINTLLFLLPYDEGTCAPMVESDGDVVGGPGTQLAAPIVASRPIAAVAGGLPGEC